MTVPIPSKVSNSPVFNDAQFFDNGGYLLAGGLISTYEAGGYITPQTTFNCSAGTTPNSNPITLDSAGRTPGPIWLADGYTYNMTIAQPDGTILASYENINGVAAVPAGGGVGTVLWNVPTAIPEYVSSIQFRLNGFFIVEFAVGNRIRYQFPDNSYGYGVVTNVVFTDPYTYVTFAPDSIIFSSLVTNISWSAMVVINYAADAGAIGYTPSFVYSGANVGTQLQANKTLITQYQKSYPATLSGTTYSVTASFNPTSYVGMTLDVIFDLAHSGATTINVNNIASISLKQFSYTGALIDPVITAGLCSRLMYNGTVMILIDQLPYTPVPIVPPPAVTFISTMGTITLPSSNTFTVTAGSTGNIAVSINCFAHANYGNFGNGTFSLYVNGAVISNGYVRFIEWDSRTSGCGATLVGSITPGPGVTATFTVIYVGSGSANDYPATWLAITA